MEGVDITKVLIITAAYFVIASAFFAERKKFMYVTYVVFLLPVKFLGTAGGIEFYATIATLVITAAYIAKGYGWLKGINFTLTIFAAFQWTIAFLGSASFLLLRYQQIMNATLFHILLSSSLVVVALSLRLGKKLVIKNASQTLLLIDAVAKLSFVLFFNWFFPRYFIVLGGIHYSVLTLVLLAIAMIFAIYREYSMYLEGKIAVANGKLQSLLRWADAIITKHENVHHSKFPDIHKIHNPIVQAVMFDFIDTANKWGIEADITVSSPINVINFDSCELFNITSNFINDALGEAKLQDVKQISVLSCGNDGFSFVVKTKIKPSKKLMNIERRKSTVVKLLKRNRNSSISVSVSIAECFTQSLHIS